MKIKSMIGIKIILKFALNLLSFSKATILSFDKNCANCDYMRKKCNDNDLSLFKEQQQFIDNDILLYSYYNFSAFFSCV